MWELIFLMLVMKIPIAYLCAVVWWAIRAEPLPPEGAGVTVSVGPEPPLRPCRSRRPRGLRLGPHGGPTRSYPRTRRAALAQARTRR